ncbi:PEBP-like protein [Auriculariales sp. MPI-PUGE-AT-0066]|nr:PEBP-like protein [Auriculariales sp. MPI-PUGE-AT-0066]
MTTEAFDSSLVLAALQREHLVPDILPASLNASDISVALAIRFPTSGAEAALGNELLVADTQERPVASWPEVDGTSYTLVCLDPDAPTRDGPIYRSFRHWVLPGLSSANGIADGADVTPWRTPGPRPASGIHRYTFLLFEEPAAGFKVPEGATEWGAQLEERRSWDALKFAQTYNLKLVGANFFLVKAL